MATELKTRTKKFALEIVRLYSGLQRKTEAQVLGRQMLRSGTSVGAHYHEAQRAKSDADFISKIEGALQELQEAGYWLELLHDSGFGQAEKLKALRQETNELIGILSRSSRQDREPRTQSYSVVPFIPNFILHPSAFILCLGSRNLGRLLGPIYTRA